MILLNITILSNEDIHEELKSWILTRFIPLIEDEKIFQSQSLLKMIDSPNEGVTYALQFKGDNLDSINLFREKHLVHLHNIAQQSFPDKVYFFESLMEYQ